LSYGEKICPSFRTVRSDLIVRISSVLLIQVTQTVKSVLTIIGRFPLQLIVSQVLKLFKFFLHYYLHCELRMLILDELHLSLVLVGVVTLDLDYSVV